MQLTASLQPSDEQWMKLALAEAEIAAKHGEVPVGAVVVKDGVLIASGRNAQVGQNDPAAHAEINALRTAGKLLGNYRLNGCTLYVTLEPCAMCSGAVLNSRVSRLVFGAFEPKTGAVGSVVNLLDSAQLNHHTEVCGGVLAEACASILSQFFKSKRRISATGRVPLREDALRTPESAFASLSSTDWPPSYVTDLPSLQGLRMHYVDVGPRDLNVTWLCIHDPTSWGYVFKGFVDAMPDTERVLVPDLIGFGRSDKPKKMSFHQIEWHCQVLVELLERLELQSVILVLDGWYSGLLMRLCEGFASRVHGVVVLPPSAEITSLEEARSMYRCPFPDHGYSAGMRAFSSFIEQQKLVPSIKSLPAEFSEKLFSQSKWLFLIERDKPFFGMEKLPGPIKYIPPYTNKNEYFSWVIICVVRYFNEIRVSAKEIFKLTSAGADPLV